MGEHDALQDPAQHVDSDQQIVAKHAGAEAGHFGTDFFDIIGTVDPDGFEAARQKGYQVHFVATEGGDPCTRFVHQP